MSKNTNKSKESKGQKAASNLDAAAARSVPAKQAVSGTGITPWISFRTGLIIITVCSIGMAVLTAWQSYEGGVGLLDSILYGLLYGGLIWAIFYISQVFFRWLRR